MISFILTLSLRISIEANTVNCIIILFFEKDETKIPGPDEKLKQIIVVHLIGEEGKLVEPPPEYRYLLHRRPEGEGGEEEEEGERKEPMHTAEQRVRPRYTVVKTF